jgi:Zn-dependent peptidase ImmA (M78 family)
MSGYEPAEESQLTKPAVQKLAESVARQVGYEPGGKLRETIEKLGGCINVEDTLLTDPEQTGSLFVDGPNKFRIIVPAHTSPERDRFTIAHEFGHFILHYMWKRQKNPNYPPRVFALRKGSKRIEWEANWFAAAFLMPAGPFRDAYETHPGDYWTIAEKFGVSPRAAEVRAEDLGLAH